MRSRIYGTDYRPLFWVTIIFICIGLGYWINFSNETTQTHTILSIDKVEATNGDSDGFHTTVYYQVSTDKGAYKITTEGFNAAPECAGIKKDSTYVLTTRGVRASFFGYYPCIIRVKE